MSDGREEREEREKRSELEEKEDREDRIDHDQRGYAVGFHEMDCFGRESSGAHGLGVAAHDLIHASTAQIHGSVQRAAQIAVRENAEHMHVLIDDGRHSETLAGHFHQALRQSRGGPYGGHVCAGPHDIVDVQQQAPSEVARGTRAREVGLKRRDPGDVHKQPIHCDGSRER